MAETTRCYYTFCFAICNCFDSCLRLISTLVIHFKTVKQPIGRSIFKSETTTLYRNSTKFFSKLVSETRDRPTVTGMVAEIPTIPVMG